MNNIKAHEIHSIIDTLDEAFCSFLFPRKDSLLVDMIFNQNRIIKLDLRGNFEDKIVFDRPCRVHELSLFTQFNFTYHSDSNPEGHGILKYESIPLHDSPDRDILEVIGSKFGMAEYTKEIEHISAGESQEDTRFYVFSCLPKTEYGKVYPTVMMRIIDLNVN